METIVAIIIAVFGILQIMLFFKLWAMTGDIKEINSKLNEPTYFSDAKTAYLNGQKEIAERFLRKALHRELKKYANMEQQFYSFGKFIPDIKKKYVRIYEDFEIEAPDFTEYENIEYVKNLK